MLIGVGMRVGKVGLAVGCVAALAAFGVRAWGARQELPELSEAERLFGLSMIWSEATYNFPFFDRLPDLDWDEAYRQFVPRVIEAPDTYEYYRVLQRFVGLLEDGHSGVSLPRVDGPPYWSNPWILTRRIEDRLIVRASGASLQSVIPAGSEILTIDGRPAGEAALERHGPYLSASTRHDRTDRAFADALEGHASEEVHISWETPTGETHERTFARDRRTRDDTWVPDVNAGLDEYVTLEWVDDGIARVELKTFNTPEVVDHWNALLPQLRRARALVIDVRSNGGGNSSNGWRIAGWLTDEPIVTSFWSTREYTAAFKGWNRPGHAFGDMTAFTEPRSHGSVEPAEGARIVVPTVVLMDHGTYSAAEDFLIVVEQMPHVTLVGRPSGGSTGNPIFFELPGGGFARIVSKRDTYPDGRDFVGVGVQPDVLVEPTVDDFRTGRDRQLERAVEILKRLSAEEMRKNAGSRRLPLSSIPPDGPALAPLAGQRADPVGGRRS